MKPSIHELISVGSMEVDGQTNNNENVHGIVVTPEIANMMSTPTQIGKELKKSYVEFSLFLSPPFFTSRTTQKFTIQTTVMRKCTRIRMAADIWVDNYST